MNTDRTTTRKDKEPLIIEALASSNLGGGEMVAIDLATSLRESGRNVAIWCPSEGPSSEHARQRNIPVEILGNTTQYTGHLGSHIKRWIRITSLCRRQKVSVIHCHSPFCYQQLSRFIPHRVKTIAHVQIDNNLHLFPWLFKRTPDVIVTCADYLAHTTTQSLAKAGSQIPRIIAVPNSVNTDLFFPSENNRTRKKECLTALMLANLAPHKGHKTAINAISQLIERGLQIDLNIAGVDRKQTGYEQELRALAINNGIEERVHFLGFQPSPASLLRDADFMLLPSTAEGLPLSILEAQASKTLVIANPVAGIPEVITDGVTGYLIDHTDYSGYANTIQQLINNPQKHESIVTQAYENIQQNYTWSKYVKKTEALYDKTTVA